MNEHMNPDVHVWVGTTPKHYRKTVRLRKTVGGPTTPFPARLSTLTVLPLYVSYPLVNSRYCGPIQGGRDSEPKGWAVRPY